MSLTILTKCSEIMTLKALDCIINFPYVKVHKSNFYETIFKIYVFEHKSIL